MPGETAASAKELRLARRKPHCLFPAMAQMEVLAPAWAAWVVVSSLAEGVVRGTAACSSLASFARLR